MKRTLLGILGILVILTAAFFGFVYSGLYNTSASKPDPRFVVWTLHTVMIESVKARAKDVKVPADFSKGKNEGSAKFQMCVLCHGGPGLETSFIGKGLNPAPPDLRMKAIEWTPAELFYIVKSGIKMSGMPSFGRTQTDEDIWNVVAYVKDLADIKSEKTAQDGTPGAVNK